MFTIQVYKYTHNPNRNKFNILMSSNSAKVIKSVAEYLYRSLDTIKYINPIYSAYIVFMFIITMLPL